MWLGVGRLWCGQDRSNLNEDLDLVAGQHAADQGIVAMPKFLRSSWAVAENPARVPPSGRG